MGRQLPFLNHGESGRLSVSNTESGSDPSLLSSKSSSTVGLGKDGDIKTSFTNGLKFSSKAVSPILLLLIGVTFHLLYSWSVFDIYFQSPLVHGMTPLNNSRFEAPAKRLILFSADGLRADKIFEDSMKRAPFLHKIAINKGTIGVSHTRVPTESRPGHVAMIAGFYEDVSAVTKGWKTNPVEFDSLFNETSHTFAFGSPDILPMFGHGCSDPNRMDMFMYPPEFEDFGDADARGLDEWVFDHFDKLLTNATNNKKLYDQLHNDKVVIFFHLLGLDTNGHAHKPNSKEYLGNIEYVDEGIKKAVQKIEKFFKHDGKTSYVFTADHGMTDIGNHGDGNPQSTQTPFIAWGAGINSPKVPIDKSRVNYENPELFNYLHALAPFTRRIDINQADIAPLMATLIGVPYPLNSVGILPVEYLSIPLFQRAEALFNSMQAILAQHLIKDHEKFTTVLFYKPFEKLVDWKKKIKSLNERLRFIRTNNNVFGSGSYSEKEIFSSLFEMINLSLEGLMYYQTYDMPFLRGVIALGYIGWIVFAISNLLIRNAESTEGFKTPSIMQAKNTRKFNTSSLPKEVGISFKLINSSISIMESLVAFFIYKSYYICTFVIYSFIVYLRSGPWRHYCYGIFPIFFWCNVWSKHNLIIKIIKDSIASDNLFGLLLPVVYSSLYVVGLELLVYSYFNRAALTPYMWVLGLAWPLGLLDKRFWKRNSLILSLFILSCFSTSIFTLLPTDLHVNSKLITIGGFVSVVEILVMLLYYRLKHSKSILYDLKRGIKNDIITSPTGSMTKEHRLEDYKSKKSTFYQKIWILQAFLGFSATMITLDTDRKLELREGLPYVNKTLSWITLLICVALPWISKFKLKHENFVIQVLTVVFSFIPVFILLSASYETLFFISFSNLCITWMYLEADLFRYNKVMTANRIILEISEFNKLDSRPLASPTIPSSPASKNPFTSNDEESQYHCIKCQSKFQTIVHFKDSSLLSKLSTPLSPSAPDLWDNYQDSATVNRPIIDEDSTPLGTPVKPKSSTELNVDGSNDSSPNTRYDNLRKAGGGVVINKSPSYQQHAITTLTALSRSKNEILSGKTAYSVDTKITDISSNASSKISLVQLLKKLKNDYVKIISNIGNGEDIEIEELIEEQDTELNLFINSKTYDEGGSSLTSGNIINHIEGCPGCSSCGYGCVCGRTGELSFVHVRVALIFLLLINIAFFGTGNMASIGSFSLESVYRLITVFDPFLMSSLLIFKILIPFFVLSCVLGVLSGPTLGLGTSSVINKISNSSALAIFEIVIATTDIMTLNFFFLVRNEGSWLEIGTTISHFIIASAFIIFQIILFLISKLLVTTNSNRYDKQRHKIKHT